MPAADDVHVEITLMDAVQRAMEKLKQTSNVLAQSGYILAPPPPPVEVVELPQMPKGVTAEDIALAFDVPLELITPTCVNQISNPEPEPVLPVYKLETPIDWAKHINQWAHDYQLPVATAKMSDHAWGTAVDINVAGGMDHTHFEPDTSEMYYEGDGDIDAKTAANTFTLLGKAQPVAVTPPKTLVWETDLGTVVQNGEHCAVTLRGIVSTGDGAYSLGADLVTLDVELAKKLIGVIPNDGPGTGLTFFKQMAGGKPYTWEAGTGWVPDEPPAPLYAAFPEVHTTKGWVKFGDDPGYQAWKAQQDKPEAVHIAPDGSRWEFRTKGGWWRVEAPGADGLFAESDQMAPYGWFCTFCSEHMSVHKGDPVACDSGGWLRPATAAEHKRALL